MCGCAAQSTADSGTNQSVPPDSAAQAQNQNAHTAKDIMDMLADSGLCGGMDARADFSDGTFEKVCENLYGVSADEVSDGGIMYSSVGTVADEVSILGKDGGEEILKTRAENRKADFEGYAPDESAKAENARIFTAGGLTFLVIADNAQEIEDKIKSDLG